MLKKYINKIAAPVLVVMLAASAVSAQVRISFKPGASSATVGALIQPDGSRQYVVRGKAGQTISLRITSATGGVTVSTRAHSPGTDFSYRLEEDGDVNLFVENAGALTRYKLTVAIR